ncbi:MAG: hypothetical protein AAB215_04490 [Planctomycetota bacterium]
MNPVKIIDFLRDRCRLLAWIGFVVFAILAAVDAVPSVIDKAHAHTEAEKTPLFWPLFGFVGCALIIILSKAFGHAGIMKREDFYDE